jgi:hypothetical protein
MIKNIVYEKQGTLSYFYKAQNQAQSVSFSFSFLSFFFFFFVVLGFELRAYTLNHSNSPLFVCVLGVFMIGCGKLFAQAGLKPRSSLSLPPK